MIVGTAGHIDHGKTALVKALTGVDADRLQAAMLREPLRRFGCEPWKSQRRHPLRPHHQQRLEV